MNWWKRLLGGRRSTATNAGSRDQASDGADEQFYLATGSETDTRAEHVLPGTADIPRILDLAPPPMDSALAPDLRPERDFAPDPVATHAIEWPSAEVFSRDELRAALSKDMMERFGRPWLYVRLPRGRVTYLSTSNDAEVAPKASALIAAWDLREEEGNPDQITAGAIALFTWLANRPERFSNVPPDTKKLQQQLDAAQAVIAVKPEYVAILAKPKNAMLDGRTVWLTLHGMGIRWGDMDQFQWPDQTGQTDYLFWAEVDDGEIGYALPEWIADGRQNFQSVRFTFNVARTPSPQHVLGQMQRAAETFAKVMDCDLLYTIDQSEVPGISDLEVAVASSAQQLRDLGVKPGSSSVCQLR